MPLPLVVRASALQAFNFYQDGAVYQGANFQGALFKLVKQFEAHQRSEAYEFARELAVKGKVILSSYQNEVQIWADVCVAVSAVVVSTVDPDGTVFSSRLHEIAAEKWAA